jgi:hypothetical protein
VEFLNQKIEGFIRLINKFKYVNWNEAFRRVVAGD